MTPLQTFSKIAKALAKSPMHFWDIKDQTALLRDTDAAAIRLKDLLEKKNLTDTQAYKHLDVLEKAVTEKDIDELTFVQALANLVEVYRLAPPTEDLRETLSELSPYAIKAKQRVLEYHIALEQLRKKGKKMTEDQKLKSDQEIIKKIGVFYVLEYTLQVLYEFTRVSDTDKKKLMQEGLKTDAGNLPAYLPLEDTMRKELCYKVFDEKFHDELLRAFYDFEQVCYGEDMKVIGQALKQFNLTLLKAFQAKGMRTFKAVAYAPFGNDIAVEDLVSKIEAVKI